YVRRNNLGKNMAGKIFCFRLYFILILIMALGFVSGYIYSTGLFAGRMRTRNSAIMANEAAGSEAAAKTGSPPEAAAQPRDLMEAVYDKDRLSYRADFVFKTYYAGCGHTVYNYGTATERYVGLSEEELGGKFPGWGIEEFTSHRVTF